MKNEQSTTETQKKRRGRPPGTSKEPLSSTSEHARPLNTSRDSSPARRHSRHTASRSDESRPSPSSPFTMLLHSLIQGNRSEVARVAREMEVSGNTVYRWMNGDSVPRVAYLKRLPDVFPEHRNALVDAINQTFHLTFTTSTHGLREVGKDIYLRALDLSSLSLDDETRFWNVTKALFEYALQHLDPDQRGLAITYARLMAPHADGSIHSLREIITRGHTPWPDAVESKAFLGNTTLAGTAAHTQRLQTWNDTDNDRALVEVDEHERSACAVPIVRGNMLAGVLIFSSTQTDFFKDYLVFQAISEYALLMHIALADRDFHSIDKLALRPMPPLGWQREEITRTYVNRIIIYARKHATSRRLAEHQVLQDLEHEFEAFALSHITSQQQPSDE